MTCITAIVHEGEIYMAGDSGTFSGNDRRTLPDGKVFKSGEFLMGSSGDARGAQLLRYAFKPPAIDWVDDLGVVKTPDLSTYMNTSFVDALRACYKDKGFARTSEGKETAQAWVLVGVRGRLFIVYSDYSVEEDTRPYAAVGCGQDLALGCMATIFKWASHAVIAQPAELVRHAVEVAIEHNIAVTAPITSVSTKDAEDA